MPQNLSLASALEKNRLDSDVALLIALDIEVVDPNTGVVAEVLHFVRNNEEVVFQGVPYVAAHFDISFDSESGSQANVMLSITDYTQAVQARMEQYGGGVGFNVTMMLINSAALGDPPDVVEFFQVLAASAAEYRVEFGLGAENEILKTFPRRMQRRDICGWRYKDPDTCRYSGPMASCDLSLTGTNGCRAHSNSPNFGGFAGLNANNLRYG